MIAVAVADLGIERLIHIDHRIDAHEGEALRDRWEFGHLMVAAREGMDRLPNGYMAMLMERTGKSRRELGYRVQFAESYPTEDELCTAVHSFASWTDLRESLKQSANDGPVTTTATVPEGQFGTIVADPPWSYSNTSTRGAAEDHYGTMTIEELCDLDIARDKAAEQSHLYLWSTAGHLPEAFRVMEAWDFEYKTYLVWVKPQMGMGNYFRVSTELVLFGVRGGLRTSERDIMNYFQARRGKHSTKPLVFQDIVAKTSPGPYLEMFTRCYADQMITGCTCSKCRLGWETWGDQS
jgi:N6-adenosine-specific RNA methylase IME4